ncbi:MAG: 4Fe-4S binding protein [Firmicutes bacterium]|nr:4Fe-4S binding protein [Bacillota bacterium]
MGKILTARNMNKCIGCYSCMLACARLVHRSFSLQKSCIQIRTRGGLQSKLVADICRGCSQPACAEACRIRALVPREGGGVKLNARKCIGCGDCVEACPVKTIRLDEETRLPLICKHCGICAKFCPHGILSLEVSPHA